MKLEHVAAMLFSRWRKPGTYYTPLRVVTEIAKWRPCYVNPPWRER